MFKQSCGKLWIDYSTNHVDRFGSTNHLDQFCSTNHVDPFDLTNHLDQSGSTNHDGDVIFLNHFVIMKEIHPTNHGGDAIFHLTNHDAARLH